MSPGASDLVDPTTISTDEQLRAAVVRLVASRRVRKVANDTGLSQTTIVNLREGGRRVTLDALMKIVSRYAPTQLAEWRSAWDRIYGAPRVETGETVSAEGLAAGASRVTEVWVRSPDANRRGSGFLLGHNLVMTSAHVVGEPSAVVDVAIRTVGTSEWRTATPVFLAREADIALLEASGVGRAEDVKDRSSRESAAVLSAFAGAVAKRAEESLNPSDLDTAVSLLRDLLRTADSGGVERWLSLARLADVLRSRYAYGGSLEDAEEAIALLWEALAAVPSGHPDRPAMLSNLAAMQRARYERTGDVADLDGELQSLRQAIASEPRIRGPATEALERRLADAAARALESRGPADA
jgi:hypothetical protein